MNGEDTRSSSFGAPLDASDLDSGFSTRGIFSEALAPTPPQPARIQQHPRNSSQQQKRAVTIDISKQGAHINRFSISGVSRIRSGFLSDLLEPVFQSRTIKEAVDETREAAGKLRALGIAKAVLVEMDRSGEKEGALDVHFHCQDGSRYMVKTGVDVGDSEGMASVTGRVSNIWGGGESFEANYSRGSKTQAAFQGTLSAPLDADPRKRLEATANQAILANRPYSSHDELRRTLNIAYKQDTFGGMHELCYSLSWRDICNLGLHASPSLRRDAGHSLKSSIAYTFSSDSRDSATVPTCGSYARVGTELAGIGGDVQFAKSNFELQSNQDLGRGYVLSSSLHGGLLWGARTSIADRFFLGGNTSVRGFEHRGIGPRDGEDSLGGDVFYAVGLSLLTPLPYVKTDALKGHLWANSGQCALLDSRGLGKAGASQGMTSEMFRFLTSPSASVGLGLVYRHSLVRVELSCCLPVVATTTDRPKPGMHFGLGFQFL
ncbi:hypothetical protein J3B02_003535 [Coemansia erecta]|uniref:Bacterial surface antigen (D15) domain-containing protein n=1 Tax=Coemansia asiatica TaxID=1052880 RepID=A0A9W7XID9_9FUNG|nr:hypothetical protein LPJ64_004397 [Coemansia asiatica]KAJ2851679.1 hypothetical protein J3B02_003535 [Coemansia erecta]KAJ2875023.1 hypothetical protein FB639_004042 [Coemansia asiatica]